MTRKAPPGRTRAGRLAGSAVVAATVRAGPDKREALAAFVVEEVGVDGSGEARIVELEAEIVAALVRALGPGRADLRLAGEHAVRGGVLAGAVFLGDDPDVLRLDREGDDLAGVFARGRLLEGSDGSHVQFLSDFAIPRTCGLDG